MLEINNKRRNKYNSQVALKTTTSSGVKSRVVWDYIKVSEMTCDPDSLADLKG